MSFSQQISAHVQKEQKDLQVENKSTPTQMPNSKNVKSKGTAGAVQVTPVVADVAVAVPVVADVAVAVPVVADVDVQAKGGKMKKLFSHKKENAKAGDETESQEEPKAKAKASKKRAKKEDAPEVAVESGSAESSESAEKPKSKRSKKEKKVKEEDRYDELEKLESDSDVTQKKRKQSPKAKDPDAPKRPLSSFMVFSGLNRQEVKQSNPELKATQIAVKLGEMWGLLTDEQKAVFKTPSVVSVVVAANESGDSEPQTPAATRQKKAKADESPSESSSPKPAAKRQKKAKADKTEKDEKADKKAKKAEKKAKRAEKKALNPDAPPKKPSSFMQFSNEHRKEVQAAHPDFKITQVAQELGLMWHQLTADEKSKYNIIVIEPPVPAVVSQVPPIETF